MTDIIKAVRQFTEAVGCTTDRYNVRQTALYTGLQLEEMAEKLEAIFGFNEEADFLHQLADNFKRGTYDEEFKDADRAEMLDSDIDLAWVTIGSALSQGADVEGAAGEVARANLSKLIKCDEPGNEDDWIRSGHSHQNCKKCNGIGLVAINDENGKVRKPPEWTPPNIEPFVYKESA